MRRLWLLLVALGLLAGCRLFSGLSDSEGSDPLSVSSYEGELGMKPGVGWESIFEDVRGVCVEFDGVMQAEGTGQGVIYRMYLVENHQDLAKALNISSASQLKAAVPDTSLSVSNKTKFAMGNTYSVNRYSVWVLVEMQVRNETTHLNNVMISPNITKALKDDPNALTQYRLQCGDAYLAAYTTGGELYGIIEIQTDSDEAKSSVAAEVQSAASVAGLGSAGSEVGFESSLRRAVSNRQHKIYYYQRGGAGADEIGSFQNVDQLFERARQLPTFVKDGNNAKRITATFLDYFTLDIKLPDSYRQDLLVAQGVMRDLAEFQSRLQDLQADIDYVRSHPNAFEDVTGPKLIEMRDVHTRIRELMHAVQAVVQTCKSNYKDCRKPAALTLPEFELPKRRQSIETINRDKVVVRTKLRFIDVKALQDAPFNPPECYLLIEVGIEGKGTVPVHRTPTTIDTPRCRNLEHTIEIPIARLKSTAESIGGTLDDAFIKVQVWEDDIVQDDLIGENYFSYKRLVNDGAVSLGIDNKLINLDVGAEMR